jgi:hypothetical protein
MGSPLGQAVGRGPILSPVSIHDNNFDAAHGAFSFVCFCKALHWDNEPGGQSVSAFEKNICSERIVPCRRPARQHCPHKPTARRIPLKKRLGGHVL